MKCAHGKGVAETQLEKVPDRVFMLIVVNLVHDEESGALGLSNEIGSFAVFCGQPGHRIDHKQYDVGVVKGLGSLGGDLVIKLITVREPTACVDDVKRDTTPFGFDAFAVSSHPWVRFDDCFTSADNPVDQGGLAHIWTSNNDDLRERHD
jgi:hypothetical protein